MNLLTIRTNMLWLKLVLTVLAFGACGNAHAQLWENFLTFGGTAEEQSYSMLQLKDQGYLLVGRSEDPVSMGGDGDKDVAVYRTDVDGREIWRAKIDPNFSKTERGLDAVIDSDGNIYIAGELDYFTNPSFDIYLIKLDSRGNLIWEQVIGELNTNEKANAIELTEDGHLIIAGSKESDTGSGNGGLDAYAAKFTLDGELVWEQTLGYNLDDIAYDILEQDEYYAFTGKSKHPQTESFDIFLAELDKSDGSLQGSFNLISTAETEEEAKSFLWDDADNSYVIVGKQDIDAASSNMIWTKVRVDEDNPGVLEFSWDNPYSSYNGPADLGDGAEKIIKTTQGQFVIAGFEEITNSKIGFTVLVLNNEGTGLVGSKTFEDPEIDPLQGKNYFVSDLVERPNQQGYAISGTRSNLGASFNDIFLFRTGPELITFSNTIQGKVYNDLNNDCGFDNGETTLKNWIVQATRDDGYQYISSTNMEGGYSMAVPPGNYEVVLLEKNTNWDTEVCASNVSISFIGNNQDEEIDFGVAPNENCAFPYLEINTSTLGVDCNEGEITYEVLTTNYGAFTSGGTTVEVILDEKYEYLASSIAGTVNGNQVLFEIGDLSTNEDNIFTITVSTDCSEALDLEAYEFVANIVDAELCDPDGDYNFETYAVETTCIDEGTMEVTIKNNGPSIAALAGYIIIEDIVISREEVINNGNPITINPGNDFKDTIVLQDIISTGRIIVPQTEDYPGRSIATDFVEGCTDDNEFNTGYVLNFLEDDAEGFTAIDVQENKPLPTGNFMEVTPRGLPSNNAISSESALKYRIYFENETADTAFTMTIRDTLPEQTILIQEGNSSHPYAFDVYENNVVRFTYDSTPFAPGDKGYVEFKLFVEQDATEGCEPIENNALIIFENQVPIQTNTVKNELCGSYAEFVEIVDTPLAPTVPELDMAIYPNPFQTECTIELKGLDIYFWSLELYTLSGQLVQTHNSSSETLTLNRSGLENGVYIVKVLADNQVVKTAKLVVH